MDRSEGGCGEAGERELLAVRTSLETGSDIRTARGPSADAGSPATGRKAKVVKLIVTGCLVLEWFRLGLYQDIIGPTLPFLKSRIGSDYSAVTQALSGKALGLVAGATLGGIFEENLRYASALIICLSQLVCAICIAALPYALHVGLYWAAFITMGLLEGAINVFGQGLLFTLWKAKAAGPLQLLHFGFGCGSCIMPLVVSMFFPKEEVGEKHAPGVGKERLNGTCVDFVHHSTTAVSWVFVDASNESEGWLSANDMPDAIADSSQEGSLVPYAYLLLAVFGVVCSSLFCALFIAERRNRLGISRFEPKSKSKMALSHSFRLKSCLPHGHVKVVLILVLMVAFAALLAATDRTFGSFIFVYAKEELCFSDSAAVALNSAFWGVFTGGRVVGFFVAHHVHPKFLLPAEVIGMASCSMVLAIFKGTDDRVTWVFCLGTAFFLGPIFPSLLAWANRYISVTGMVITLIMLGVAVGVAGCQIIIGHFLNQHGGGAVVYFAAGQTGLLILLAIALQPVAHKLGDRYHTGTSNNEQIMNTEMTDFEKVGSEKGSPHGD